MTDKPLKTERLRRLNKTQSDKQEERLNKTQSNKKAKQKVKKTQKWRREIKQGG